MKCTPIDFGNGATGFICSRGARTKRCSVDGCGRPAPKLCDYPLAGAKAGKTCDRALCEAHATQIGEEPLRRMADPRWAAQVKRMAESPDTVDVCPVHARVMAAEAKSEPIIVHVIGDMPNTSRCKIPSFALAMAVSKATAAKVEWGGSVRGLAVCAKCARGMKPARFSRDFPAPKGVGQTNLFERKDSTR